MSRTLATAPARTAAGSSVLPSRLPSLTGLRFFAALGVFFFHTSLTGPPALTPFDGRAREIWARIWSTTGSIGVSFFFLLSGFVLTHAARPGLRKRTFWRRRVVKLFPNHVVTWALAMVLFAAATSTWHQWLPNLAMVHAWFPYLDVYLSVNPPSWSLACELFFYLCFPFLHALLRRVDPARLWALALVLTAAIALVPAAAYALLPGGTTPNGFPVSAEQFWAVYMFPPVRTLEFALGIVMALIVAAGRLPRIGVPVASVLALAAWAGSMNVPWLYSHSAVTALPLALLIAAIAVRDLGGAGSVLHHPALLWLGEVSFAFYMVHGTVITYVKQLMGFERSFAVWQGAAIVVLYLGVSLALAWLLYAVVEKPAMRAWSRSRR
ncbi:acyltransferase family protein [Kitasatospora sp. NPDC059722]|uniref:acyltransferase family protein n=1 Tax=unclassified Kitasatospora TaxID=2633591 RepID=UPI0036512354